MHIFGRFPSSMSKKLHSVSELVLLPSSAEKPTKLGPLQRANLNPPKMSKNMHNLMTRLYQKPLH